MYVSLRPEKCPHWLLACVYGYWSFGVGQALGWFGWRLYVGLKDKRSLVQCVLAVSGFLVAMMALLVIDSKLQDRWFDHLDSITPFGFGAYLMWQAYTKDARDKYGIGKPKLSANGAKQE